MPVVEVSPGRFRWGKRGKVYPSRAQAERQGRAAYANGYRDDKGQPLGKVRLHQRLAASRPAEARFRLDLARLFGAMHREVERVVFEQLRRDEPVDRQARADAPPPKAGTKGATKKPVARTAIVAAAGAVSPKLLGDIHGHLQKGGTVAFDRMAKGVHSKTGEAVDTIIPIRPKAAGLEDLVDDAREKGLSYLYKAGRDYADDVRDVLEDPSNFQRALGELEDLIRERADVSLSRANLIATDQTLKLNSSLMRARHEAAGIDRYTWSTSLDERVRPMHAELEGEEFRYDDPPVTNEDGDTNNPGDDYRCRCVAAPIVEPEEPEESEEGTGEEEEDDNDEE